ncbi:MAG: ATP-dependent sacrificial sulfur transferase LarE [Mogibacterium sp.]|nr:ATP-dependent sacrificial sulfur transferase LarE [Mogibacterium sp.]
MDHRNKLAQLKESIASYGSLAVAFSGGVDSTFLLAVAHEVLGDKAVAVTCRNAFVPAWEFTEAADFCRDRGVRHIVVDIDPLADDRCVTNPPDRCYWCKRLIFGALIEASRAQGITHIADGSNTDDLGDYRPGLLALDELNVLSPLRAAGLSKGEIRALSQEMGLPTWSKPSYACLASRIAYGEEITVEKLRMVEQAEDFLTGLGFTGLRVRVHGPLARIEVPQDQIAGIAADAVRADIVHRFKDLGFLYVTLDLAGYRTGSMNAGLTRQP